MARNAVYTALMSIVFWWVDCSVEVVNKVYFTQVLLVLNKKGEALSTKKCKTRLQNLKRSSFCNRVKSA